MKGHRYLLLVLLLSLSLLLAACGGDSEPAPVVEESPAVVETVEETAAEPTEEVAEVEEVVEEPAEVVEAVEEVSVEALNTAYDGVLATMVRYNTVSVADTNLALAEAPAPFLLDVRQPEEAEEKGHIEGAVLIPLRELGQNLNLLPSFDTPIITYCGSGWRATIAMTTLKGLGWQDVTVMTGGSYGGWVEEGYPTVAGIPPVPAVMDAASPDAAMAMRIGQTLGSIPEGWGVATADGLNTELIEEPNLILIDVRKDAELADKGFVDTTNELIRIPVEELIARQAEWPADKDANIVIYCGSGHRSTMAMAILRSYGYTNVRSLKGGFGGWVDAGYAVAGGIGAVDEAFASFLDSMEAYNTIGLEDVNLALIEDPPPFLLDVRQPSEAEEKGHIESAVLIPLRELGQHMDLLPSFDTPIVAYCGSGWRATIAMTVLEALGWQDVTVMKGGSYGGWVEAGYPTIPGLPAEPMVLDVAQPDPELLARADQMLSSIPEGWGVATAEALNTELIEDPALILMDVRTDAELASKGIIDTSNELIPLPIEQFVAMKELWPADKDANIVVYCGSGHRSTIAMAILRSYGYTNVRSLKGGFGGWAGEGYPVAGGIGAVDEAFASFLDSMVAYNTIGLEDVNLALIEDPPPFLLDVRQPSEAEEKGHIESAVLIPLRELGQHMDVMPSFDTPIIAYCGSGWRATIAMTALKALGWEDVTVMKGGSYGGWVEAGYPTIEGLPADALVLEVAQPDPNLLARIDQMLSSIPEGWGVATAEALNTELIEDPDLILMDVRTDAELASKGVVDSSNELIPLPIEQFVAMKDLWPADKDANIVVYCGSGHRSTIAMSILGSYGYTNVRSLKGGFGGWVEAGFPVAEFVAQ